MAKTSKVEKNGAAELSFGLEAPADLHFDRQNPRFIDLIFKAEIDILRELYHDADVDELLQSILTAGYLDFELGPPNSADSRSALADWMELKALAGERGDTSRNSLLEVLDVLGDGAAESAARDPDRSHLGPGHP